MENVPDSLDDGAIPQEVVPYPVYSERVETEVYIVCFVQQCISPCF
jgi:hypothetical protein